MKSLFVELTDEAIAKLSTERLLNLYRAARTFLPEWEDDKHAVAEAARANAYAARLKRHLDSRPNHVNHKTRKRK